MPRGRHRRDEPRRFPLTARASPCRLPHGRRALSAAIHRGPATREAVGAFARGTHVSALWKAFVRVGCAAVAAATVLSSRADAAVEFERHDYPVDRYPVGIVARGPRPGRRDGPRRRVPGERLRQPARGRRPRLLRAGRAPARRQQSRPARRGRLRRRRTGRHRHKQRQRHTRPLRAGRRRLWRRARVRGGRLRRRHGRGRPQPRSYIGPRLRHLRVRRERLRLSPASLRAH